jgi:hypothetical protein
LQVDFVQEIKMRRVHRTLRTPLPGWRCSVLAVAVGAPAQDLQGPGFSYYEVGDLEAPVPGRAHPR